MTSQTAVRELVALGSRVLASQGQDDFIWGHASVRNGEGRGAWIKAAEWGLSEVTSERVHLVTPPGPWSPAAARGTGSTPSTPR